MSDGFDPTRKSLTSQIMVKEVLSIFVRHLRSCWGESLISVVLFGSWASNRAKPESDIDVLIIKSNLPKNRYERFVEYQQAIGPVPIEEDLKSRITPILLSPEEAKVTKPYYLGMLNSSYTIYDKDHFFFNILRRLKARLDELGAERLFDDEGDEYWILKKDYQLGEAIEL
jgi:predicted nucleotidyltransferase